MKPTYYLSLSSEPFSTQHKIPCGMEIETIGRFDPTDELAENSINWNAQSENPQLFSWDHACKVQQYFYNIGLELLIRSCSAPFMPAMRRPFMNNNCYEFSSTWIQSDMER